MFQETLLDRWKEYTQGEDEDLIINNIYTPNNNASESGGKSTHSCHNCDNCHNCDDCDNAHNCDDFHNCHNCEDFHNCHRFDNCDNAFIPIVIP